LSLVLFLLTVLILFKRRVCRSMLLMPEWNEEHRSYGTEHRPPKPFWRYLRAKCLPEPEVFPLPFSPMIKTPWKASWRFQVSWGCSLKRTSDLAAYIGLRRNHFKRFTASSTSMRLLWNTSGNWRGKRKWADGPADQWWCPITNGATFENGEFLRGGLEGVRLLFPSSSIHPELVVRHEGRCGRTLTVPESIERGIGPECIKHA